MALVGEAGIVGRTAVSITDAVVIVLGVAVIVCVSCWNVPRLAVIVVVIAGFDAGVAVIVAGAAIAVTVIAAIVAVVAGSMPGSCHRSWRNLYCWSSRGLMRCSHHY